MYNGEMHKQNQIPMEIYVNFVPDTAILCAYGLFMREHMAKHTAK